MAKISERNCKIIAQVFQGSIAEARTFIEAVRERGLTLAQITARVTAQETAKAASPRWHRTKKEPASEETDGQT